MVNAEVFQFDVERHRRRVVPAGGIQGCQQNERRRFHTVGAIVPRDSVTTETVGVLRYELLREFDNTQAIVDASFDKDNFWAWIRIDCSYSTEFFNALTRKFHNVLWDTGVVKKPT